MAAKTAPARGVRITGGAFRGRAVQVPPGVRPTEGRVREALFSIWRERLPDASFLDLFAGSGVVALEAAGRGALRVVAVDQDAPALRAVAASAGRVGAGRVGAREVSARSAPRRPGSGTAAPGVGLVEIRRLVLPAGLATLAAESAGAFDLVFADPPYRFDAFAPLLLALPALLAAGGEIAVEHAARRDLPDAAGPLVRTDLRRYGESALAFYRALD